MSPYIIFKQRLNYERIVKWSCCWAQHRMHIHESSKNLEISFEQNWKDFILFTFSFLFGSILIGGLEIIKKFIQSKPPGRRLVNSSRKEIIIMQHCRLLQTSMSTRRLPCKSCSLSSQCQTLSRNFSNQSHIGQLLF